MPGALDKKQDTSGPGYPGTSRAKLGWLGASIVAHAAIVAAVIYLAPAAPRPTHDWVLAYVIDLGSGTSATAQSGGGAATASLETGPVSLPDKPMRVEVPPAPRNPEVSDKFDPSRADAMASVKLNRAAIRDARGSRRGGGPVRGDLGQTAGAASNGLGAGQGAGEGSGGALARADYGASPPPAYPRRSRRRGEQGTVTLRVLVGSDGGVVRVEVAQSSGYGLLDDAARETVRTRWRFVPARHAGTAVESWVLVPIRFALTEASAAD
jgi:periplasmic protein TonB